MILAVGGLNLPSFASLHIYYINATEVVKGFEKLFFEGVNRL